MELCPSRRHDGRAEFDTSTAEVPAAPAGLVGANLEHDLATLPAGRESLERRPPIGSAAASTWLSREGFGASTSAGTTAYSEATPSRSKGVSAYTSSPLPTTTPESS